MVGHTVSVGFSKEASLDGFALSLQRAPQRAGQARRDNRATGGALLRLPGSGSSPSELKPGPGEARTPARSLLGNSVNGSAGMTSPAGGGEVDRACLRVYRAALARVSTVRVCGRSGT